MPAKKNRLTKKMPISGLKLKNIAQLVENDCFTLHFSVWLTPIFLWVLNTTGMMFYISGAMYSFIIKFIEEISLTDTGKNNILPCMNSVVTSNF